MICFDHSKVWKAEECPLSGVTRVLSPQFMSTWNFRLGLYLQTGSLMMSKMRSHWSMVSPKPSDRCSYETEGHVKTQRATQRDGHVMDNEAETQVTLPQTKEHKGQQKPPEAG